MRLRLSILHKRLKTAQNLSTILRPRPPINHPLLANENLRKHLLNSLLLNTLRSRPLNPKKHSNPNKPNPLINNPFFQINLSKNKAKHPTHNIAPPHKYLIFYTIIISIILIGYKTNI